MLLVVLVVLLVLVAVLVVGGFVAAGRRHRMGEGELMERVAIADAALAQARALDQGWARSELEAAARAAYGQTRPADEIAQLLLVQVLDRPGVAHDEARMRVVDRAGEAVEVPLRRTPGGAWTG